MRNCVFIYSYNHECTPDIYLCKTRIDKTKQNTSCVKMLYIVYYFAAIKELCNNNKHQFFNPYIIATLCRSPLICQTISYVGSNSGPLKYQRLTPSGYRNRE